MFGNAKEIEELRNRLAVQGREIQHLNEIVVGLLDRVQELELKGQKPKSHFSK